MITFVSIALKGKHSDKATLVDLDVAMRLSGRRLFGINGSHGGDATYVAFNDPRAARPVHREVMDLEKGNKLEVDHINCDPLDNRRRNLEVVTRKENQRRAWLRRRAA